MKSIVLLLALFGGLALHAEPPGATDLVPRADSPAKGKLKIPDGESATTVTVKVEPSLDNYTPPASVPAAKPLEENNPFGDANISLTNDVDKAKPYALEILYGEVATPLKPVGGGSPLIPTQEFFAHAKKISIAIAQSDQGKISSTGASVVYHVDQAGKQNDTFWVYIIVRTPTVGKAELKTRLLVNKDVWNVFGGSTSDSSEGAKKYFYWAVRINTAPNSFSAGMTDG